MQTSMQILVVVALIFNIGAVQAKGKCNRHFFRAAWAESWLFMTRVEEIID